MKKAIVFAGGGSKGAYQIGIWKALNELGETFDIATGTSIGSINAAFYVQHDFDAAYEMWKQITASDIMANGINFEKSFNAMYGQRDQLLHFIKNYISSKGADVTPFHNCLRHYFSAEKFAASEVDFALMTVCFTDGLEPKEATKQDIIDRGDNGWEWIAASAAAFPVFPMMRVDGKNYIDGGFYDNIPVASAIRLGARKITVVDLKPDHSHEGYAHHPYVTYISPTRDLGTFLNFERHILDRSIKLGYNDAMKEYRRYFGRLFTFIPGEEGGDYYKELGEKFTEILTVTEAGFRYYDSVRFHRMDSVEGCSPVLWENAYHHRTDFRSFFFSALEIYMHLLGFDDTKDYRLDELIPALKESIALENTAEDFTDESGFEVFEKYLREEYNEVLSTIKEYEEDVRIKLIAVSVAKTLLSL